MMKMDWDFIAVAAILFGLTATVLCVIFRISPKAKNTDCVGQKRKEVNPAAIAEFKPSWQNAGRSTEHVR